MEEPTVEANDLIRELKDKTDGRIYGEWTPTPIDLEQLHPLADHPSLSYLHQNWEIASTVELQGLRAAVGRPKAMADALFSRLLLRALDRYIRRDQDLMSHIVRMQDALAKRCDQLEERLDQIAGSLQTDLLYLNTRTKANLERLEERGEHS